MILHLYERLLGRLGGVSTAVGRFSIALAYECIAKCVAKRRKTKNITLLLLLLLIRHCWSFCSVHKIGFWGLFAVAYSGGVLLLHEAAVNAAFFSQMRKRRKKCVWFL